MIALVFSLPSATAPTITFLDATHQAGVAFTHRASIRILGTAGCEDQQSVLLRYQKKLNAAAGSAEGFDGFKDLLADEPVVTKETVDQLKSEVEKTLKLLEQAKARD